MRRHAALIVAAFVAWASAVLAQAPNTVVDGQPFAISATHDGVNTFYYQLRQTRVEKPVSALSGNVITFDPITLSPPGIYQLTVTAVGAEGREISAPFNVQVIPLVSPSFAIGPCPYTSPAGVSSMKDIGNDDVHGWNQIDTTDLVAVRKFDARVEQLKSWGFRVTVPASDDGVHVALKPDGMPVHPVTGKPWSYVYAPCVGYLTALP